jgi:hypothetical protein
VPRLAALTRLHLVAEPEAEQDQGDIPAWQLSTAASTARPQRLKQLHLGDDHRNLLASTEGGRPETLTRVTYESSFEDVEELRKRFEEFRSQHQTRTRLPEELWRAAAEIAQRRGMSLVCRSLRLDANSLRKWIGKGVSGARPKFARRKRSTMAPPVAFAELLTPASSVAAGCIIEVESQHGGSCARVGESR